MKKIWFLILGLLISTNLFAYPSESGSGVVSVNESIVRASLEATQVLQSDTRSNLYGVTILGGTSNSASFNSGGVLSFRNVVSSIDTVKFGNNEYAAWLTTSSGQVRVGVSADNIYTIGTDTRIQGRTSGNQVAIASLFTTSINTTQIFVSGNTTITSMYTTGTCSFTFANGLLRTASC